MGKEVVEPALRFLDDGELVEVGREGGGRQLTKRKMNEEMTIRLKGTQQPALFLPMAPYISTV